MSSVLPSNFFEQLTEFLPKFVSPMKSYLHAGIAFTCVFIIVHMISSNLKLDIDGDGEESETEEKARNLVALAISFIMAIFVADVTYTISWRLRNKAVNGNHLTWRRWFAPVYGPQ